MFGFERGAFTDARQAKPGLFEVADRGILFLDEIGHLPDAAQVKLLKAIEDRSIRRLGSTRDHAVDVWIVAATSEDLAAAVRAGRFRADLYHRLAVFTVRLPPLRERGGDVWLLATHFLGATCRDYGLAPKRFGDDARGALAAYRWPGNVRELANAIERASLLTDDAVVTALDLSLPSGGSASPARGGRRAAGSETPAARPVHGGAVAPAGLDGEAERARLVAALEASGGNLSQAAERLQIPRNTLRYRLEVHGLRAAPPSRRDALAQAPRPTGWPASLAGHVVPGTGPRIASPVVIHRETRRLTALDAVVAGASGLTPHTINQHLTVVAEKLALFGGHLEDIGGDHLVAIFGHDGAEDAPRRAALAATAVRRAVESAAIAIHVQECAVGTIGGTVTIDGEVRQRLLGTLQALVSVASPGAIIASHAAAAVLERRFELVAMAGPPDGVEQIYQLTGPERAGFGVRGRITPFVGREEELEWLRTRRRAALDGLGQVVGIVGEAGLGKSRLVAELRRDALAGRMPGFEGRCLSYAATTPYLPIAAIMRQLCGIAETDGPDAVAAAVQTAMDADSLPAHAPFLIELLGVPGHVEGMSPEMVKTRTFAAVRELMHQVGARGPVLVIIEDAHWIDETSDALLNALIDGLARMPVLLLLTYRSGYRPRWLDKSYAGQLTVRPLSPEESLTVVRAVLAAPSAPGALVDAIIARAEGNPFFLEELGRALGDEGGERDVSAVPGTVHDVLAGRMARLDTPDRRLLQAAAVIGKDVPYTLLRAIAEEPDEVVAPQLSRLQAAGFLALAGPGPALEYTFRHALTHDVAYRTLLPDSRRQIHGQIVDAIEGLYADRVAEHVERLAHHAVGAERWEAAVRYLRRSAAKALARSANGEAVALVDQALAALARLPEGAERSERELPLHVTRGVALIGMHGWAAPAVERTYARARELCGQVGQTPRLLGALLGLWAFHLFRGELDAARELAEQCLAVVAPYPDSPLRGWAHLAMGTSLFWLGRLVPARGELEASLALYNIEEQGPLANVYGQDYGATCRAYLGLLESALGHPERGARSAEDAIALAERLAHPYTLAMALTMAGLTHQLLRDARSCRERAEAALALGAERGFPTWTSLATFLRGWSMGEQGQRDEGIEEMRRGIAAWRALGLELALPWLLTALAEALAGAGRMDEGLAAVAEALALATGNNDQWCESEAHRVHGALLVRQGRAAEAEAVLRRALDLARGREALGLELRVGRDTQSRVAGARRGGGGGPPAGRDLWAVHRGVRHRRSRRRAGGAGRAGVTRGDA